MIKRLGIFILNAICFFKMELFEIESKYQGGEMKCSHCEVPEEGSMYLPTKSLLKGAKGPMLSSQLANLVWCG